MLLESSDLQPDSTPPSSGEDATAPLLDKPRSTRKCPLKGSIYVISLVDAGLYANQLIEFPSRFALGENFFDRDFSPPNCVLFAAAGVMTPFFIRTLLNAYENGTLPERSKPWPWLRESAILYKTVLKTYGSAMPVVFTLLSHSSCSTSTAKIVSGVVSTVLVLSPTWVGEHVFLTGNGSNRHKQYGWLRQWVTKLGYALSSSALPAISLDGLPAHLGVASRSMLSLMGKDDYVIDAFCTVNLLCFVFNFIGYFRQIDEGFALTKKTGPTTWKDTAIDVLSGGSRGLIASSSLSALLLSLADFMVPFMEHISPKARMLLISVLTTVFFVVTLPANILRFSKKRELPSCVSHFFLDSPRDTEEGRRQPAAPGETAGATDTTPPAKSCWPCARR